MPLLRDSKTSTNLDSHAIIQIHRRKKTSITYTHQHRGYINNLAPQHSRLQTKIEQLKTIIHNSPDKTDVIGI